MSVVFSDCLLCKHLYKKAGSFYNPVFSCKAFPDGIPIDILNAEKKSGVMCNGTVAFEEIENNQVDK